MKKEKIIAGLDLGTSKIAVAVAVLTKDNKADILDVAVGPSRGFDNGAVVDLQAAVSSVEQAVEKAEQVTGRSIYSVFVSINGSHMQIQKARGAVSIAENEIEITRREIDKAIENAKNMAVPLDAQIIHVLPQGFILDGQTNIKNPAGMFGSRLEAELFIISSVKSVVNNIMKCLNGAGLEAENFIFSPIATSEAILTNEEKQAGAVVVDMGARFTDILVYNNASIEKIKVLNTGGELLTEAAAEQYKISPQSARDIKERFGAFPLSSIPEGEKVIIKTQSGQRPVPRKEICSVFERKALEIFAQVKEEIKGSGALKSPDAAIVLTGGGMMLDGIVEMAEEYFKVPTRLGYVKGAAGSLNMLTNPAYATSIGLIRYGARHLQENKTKKIFGNRLLARAASKVKDIYQDYF